MWPILATLLVAVARKIEGTECPPPEAIPGCPCYNFEDGLFLECAGATEESLKVALLGVLITSGGEGNRFEYMRVVFHSCILGLVFYRIESNIP